MKKQAKANIFRAARTIVEEIMVENCDLREPEASRQDPGLLSRVANRHRQKFRLEEPKDLNLQVPPLPNSNVSIPIIKPFKY